MNWQQALDQLQTEVPDDLPPFEALKRLNETVGEALFACIRGQDDQAKQGLVAALPQLLQTMKLMGIEPFGERPNRDNPAPIPDDLFPTQPDTQRLIYVEGNKVEVRVNDELRGSWSIWSVADLREVCRLAEEFDCGLVYSMVGTLAPSQPGSV